MQICWFWRIALHSTNSWAIQDHAFWSTVQAHVVSFVWCHLEITNEAIKCSSFIGNREKFLRFLVNQEHVEYIYLWRDDESSISHNVDSGYWWQRSWILCMRMWTQLLLMQSNGKKQWIPETHGHKDGILLNNGADPCDCMTCWDNSWNDMKYFQRILFLGESEDVWCNEAIIRKWENNGRSMEMRDGIGSREIVMKSSRYWSDCQFILEMISQKHINKSMRTRWYERKSY
jgi:hypothetical protein